jgi:hypothetical protein
VALNKPAALPITLVLLTANVATNHTSITIFSDNLVFPLQS